ncbi:uracil-DNA glycosylase [Oxynema sp. CENA135]|uniref:uracil-DNA glycosylase n=1 Tax=Oxynema sp. CENA135 TaxID=984206 RepID=UPI0019095B9A|nr:uracil-DNA glycosylase [Oxynema sp. CENA135]MBK4731821.1 uracil-DNA glycosylase [Oxynema sp. CENA135]
MSDNEQLSLFDLSDPGRSPGQSTSPGSDSQKNLIPTDANIAIPSGTYSSLDELAASCQQCHRCELAKGRTHVVVSRGNPQAKIAIVGEAPGQQEDETGLPFVGKSGQLLDKILASVELDPERDVYICNVNKCRPPGNRTPTTPEIEACKPYLLEQLRLVNPKIILLTGATAVKGTLGEKRGITKIRGQWFDWQGFLCMPIFHPAYLLRNPSRKEGSPKWLMWQDIQAVRNKLTELLQEDEEF